MWYYFLASAAPTVGALLWRIFALRGEHRHTKEFTVRLLVNRDPISVDVLAEDAESAREKAVAQVTREFEGHQNSDDTHSV